MGSETFIDYCSISAIDQKSQFVQPRDTRDYMDSGIDIQGNSSQGMGLPERIMFDPCPLPPPTPGDYPSHYILRCCSTFIILVIFEGGEGATLCIAYDYNEFTDFDVCD